MSIETQFLDSSSWTHPVQSPVHSESSVMNRLHCNVIMHILHQVLLCELRGSHMVSSEKSSPSNLRVKMGNLNCFSGGRIREELTFNLEIENGQPELLFWR